MSKSSDDLLEDILLIQEIKDGKLTHCPKCSAQIQSAVKNEDGKMVLVCRDYAPEIEQLRDLEIKLGANDIILNKHLETKRLHEDREFLLENVLLYFCNELGFDYRTLLNDLDTYGGKHKIYNKETIRKNIIGRCIEVSSRFKLK